MDYGYQRAAAESAVAGLIGACHETIPDDSDVATVTFGTAVRLTGRVRTQAEHDAVVGTTWLASGVTAVIDELKAIS